MSVISVTPINPIKRELIIRSLHEIKTDMRNVAEDMRRIWPDIAAPNELEAAANVISKWIDSIEQNTITADTTESNND